LLTCDRQTQTATLGQSHRSHSLRIRNNIDYEAVGLRFEKLAEMRGERVPEFKSRGEVISHIRKRWRNAFEDVIETGCLLILNGFSARDFPRRKPAGDEDTQFLQLTYHTARRLMMIAESERINNPADRGIMPDSWYTLYLIAWMPKTMYEVAKKTGVIHKTCTQQDVIAFIRYQKGLSAGEKIVIRLSDRPLCGFGDFEDLQNRFEQLRDSLMSFLDKHREVESWGEIVRGIDVKRGRLPRIE
jgi:hypothetical protein